MIGQRIQQEAICYQWFKQQLILSVSKPNITQRSQIKEDTIEPSVLTENLISKRTPLYFMTYFCLLSVNTVSGVK